MDEQTKNESSRRPFRGRSLGPGTIGLIFGLIGGVVGSLALIRYAPTAIPVDKRQVLVQESSAVVDVVKEVSPSVVSITSQTTGFDPFGIGRQQTQTGAGTGIIISDDGLILTNKHVVSEDAGNFSVFTSDGKEHKDAKVIARDPLNDIAFLKINARGLKAAELGDSGSLAVGQRVIAIGNALGQFENTATDGIVSGLGRPIVAGDGREAEALRNLIQTDAAINPGNSGGPLVNLDGQVIGINTAIAGNAQNIGFAIPVNEAKPLIESVKSQGRIVRPFLGVRYIPVTREFASRNNLGVEEGAYISGGDDNPAIVQDSPAAKAGLKEGDIILKVGNNKVTKNNSLTELVGRYKIGEKVQLTLLREGKESTIEVTLEEAPSS